MNLEKKFLTVRNSMGYTQENFSKIVGVSRTNYTHIESGRSKVSNDLLQNLTKNLGVNLNWLFNDEVPMFKEQSNISKPKSELNADKLKHYIEHGKSNSNVEIKQSIKSNTNSSVVSLPIVGEIAAGNPFEVADMSDLGNIIVSTELISDPDNFYCFRVNGWSMSPEIQHSDVVIINKIYDYDDMDNRIVAIRIDDGITLKLLKLDHDNKCSWLMPINDDYKPILINQYSSIIILGVLEYSIRSYK